ncbi:MAG: RDD family protein [Verrucomicrobia bacterium]|nr:RDD family protein [Verrucomicrobiota bacterium]
MSSRFKSRVMRGLARVCDYALFCVGLGTIALFLPYFYTTSFFVFLALLFPFLWAPVEAWFISNYATTPGKALFGMEIVRDGSGGKITFGEAFRRACFLSKRPGILREQTLSFRRKVFAILTTVFCVFLALGGDALAQWGASGLVYNRASTEGWVEYASDAGFKVAFPKDPETENKQLVIPNSGTVLNYEEVTSDESPKVHYKVSHMVVPRKWKLAGNATLLKGALDALVKHTEGAELVSKDFVMTHQGHRALDFHMKAEGEEVKGRFLVIGNTLYKLTVEYPSQLSSTQDASPFFDSFEET